MKNLMVCGISKMTLLIQLIYTRICTTWIKFVFKVNDVRYDDFKSVGRIILVKSQDSTICIGAENVFVNNPFFATLGKNNKCKLMTYKNASLKIGNKVGMSNTTIVATNRIELGNNIMIGGGVTIIDSDFHSLNPIHWHTDEDDKNKISKPIKICDNVFIGMNSIILKGVNIGSNSIIAAGSVVVNDIPDNEIWGGNPAKHISKRN